MIQEIINFVDKVSESSPEVFTRNLKPKEGFYILLDVDAEGELLNVDENDKINEDDIGRYSEKDEEENGLSDHLKKSKTLYFNSQVMGKGTNKSFNSSSGLFSVIATPFGIGFTKKNFTNPDRDRSKEFLESQIEAYFNSASQYIGEEENHKKWFEQFKAFCQKHLLELIESQDLLQDLKESEVVCFFLKEPDVTDFSVVSERYFSEKIFNDTQSTSKGKYGVYATTHNLNESKTFLRHITGLTQSTCWLSGKDAAKIEKFYSIQKLLPKPFPLFIDKNEVERAIKIWKEEGKIKYSEMIKNMLRHPEDELHNYYLIFFGGADYSRIIDIDFVPTFKYAMDTKIKRIFPFNKDDVNSKSINNVFEFEQQVVKPILGIHPDYYINYFGEEKFNSDFHTHNSFNQLLKYRKAFYDFIYKSKREAITQLMFDDILLKGVLDDIKNDEYDTQTQLNSKRLQILEKLNIWFSLYSFFHLSSQKRSTDMITKIERHRNKVDAIISENALIGKEDEFAYVAGQCIRYLFSKSETSDKSYNRLETFLQKTDCRLLQQAIANFFSMYKHKELTGKFGKVFAQVMDYETNANVKDYLPELLAGFFDQNKLFSDKENDSIDSTEN